MRVGGRQGGCKGCQVLSGVGRDFRVGQTPFSASPLLFLRCMKGLWRTTEWILALAWPIVAHNAVFARYGWSSPYYSKWQEIWFALVLVIPMVGPVLVKLFSAKDMDARKRFALAGLMAF